MHAPETWQTVVDAVRAARLALTPPLWAFSGSGPEYEVTIRRNRAAFDRLALLPRVLRGAGQPDTSTTFLGQHLALPVMLAPVGTLAMWHPGGAASAARVAADMGTLSLVPSGADVEAVRGACDGPLIYQLYAYQGDRDWQEGMVARVERAGYTALCVTVDSAGSGVRDRPLANRSLWMTPSGRPEHNPGVPGPVAEVAEQRYTPRTRQASLTWDDLAWLRARTRLPFILKGILTPSDAERATECGVDVIYVSNHGGRRQDQLPSTLEMLPMIVAAVAGRVPVIIDSGFMRGTDVVKAIALGARAVAIGKLMIWSLAAGGEPGLSRVLELLRGEIGTTMAALGAPTLADLSPELVVHSFDPPLAPWPVEPMDLLQS
jgi:isopentenyl diphosphate isomerase/L-lactate dehydrogenase-like FMN-dependent dehydrogenase